MIQSKERALGSNRPGLELVALSITAVYLLSKFLHLPESQFTNE